MEFDIIYYEDDKGGKPVQKFLGELKRSQPDLHRQAWAGITKLRNGDNFGEPLTKNVGDDLLELRVGRKDIARILWFFMAGKTIILVHGFVKKGNKLPEVERRKALSRKRDYEKRHTGGEQ